MRLGTKPERVVRWALLANALVCALAGLVLLARAGMIAGVFGWSVTPFGTPGWQMFRALGVLQLVLAGLAVWAGLRRPLPGAAARGIALANLIWYGLSWILAVGGAALMTRPGAIVLAAQSGLALALWLAEWAGLRLLARAGRGAG